MLITVEISQEAIDAIKYIKKINELQTDDEAISEAVTFYADKISHFEEANA